MLTASHIKEWASSTDAEKLDENNGLLLCAHHDALFDKHLITFDNAGNAQIFLTLSAQEQLDDMSKKQAANLYSQPYEPKQLICILDLSKANLYPQPLPNREVDLFPR